MLCQLLKLGDVKVLNVKAVPVPKHPTMKTYELH
jgi:hypothetical protein